MLKRTLCLLVAISTAFCLTVAAFASEEGNTQVQAAVDTQTENQTPAFFMNEQPVYGADLTVVNGVTYMSFSAFFSAAVPGCTVAWSNDRAAATGTTASGEAFTVTAKPGDCYIVANERYLYVANQVRTINGLTMAPVVVMAQVFSGTAFWDAQGGFHVKLGSALLTAGSAYYNTAMVDILSRLIFAEAGNQPMTGKIAVGNVIFNRVEDPRFPGTLYDVIYASNQFSVVNNGAINRTPNESSVIAAKLVIEGAEVVENALYFNRSGLNCWAARNRTYVTTIGAHDFYA